MKYTQTSNQMWWLIYEWAKPVPKQDAGYILQVPSFEEVKRVERNVLKLEKTLVKTICRKTFYKKLNSEAVQHFPLQIKENESQGSKVQTQTTRELKIAQRNVLKLRNTVVQNATKNQTHRYYKTLHFKQPKMKAKVPKFRSNQNRFWKLLWFSWRDCWEKWCRIGVLNDG